MVTAAGQSVCLTPRESDLLALFLSRPGRVVSRAQIDGLTASQGRGQSLDALVRGLRAKLETHDGVRRIVAVRGVGFRFTLDEPPDERAIGSPEGPTQAEPSTAVG